MDIDKLEKLSCLKIAQSDKEAIKTSLEGIFSMMSELEKIELPETTNQYPETTLFREEIQESSTISKATPQIKRKEKVLGLHIEDGYFLAPKVIKK